MLDKLKIWAVQKMSDVCPAAGKKIVQAKHVVPCRYQQIAQVTADKSRTTCHEYIHPHKITLWRIVIALEEKVSGKVGALIKTPATSD